MALDPFIPTRDDPLGQQRLDDVFSGAYQAEALARARIGQPVAHTKTGRALYLASDFLELLVADQAKAG